MASGVGSDAAICRQPRVAPLSSSALVGLPCPKNTTGILESALRNNPHYAHCVRLGQLHQARVVSVGSDAGIRYIKRLARTGQRLGDIKPTPLSPLFGWRDVFGPKGGSLSRRATPKLGLVQDTKHTGDQVADVTRRRAQVVIRPPNRVDQPGKVT